MAWDGARFGIVVLGAWLSACGKSDDKPARAPAGAGAPDGGDAPPYQAACVAQSHLICRRDSLATCLSNEQDIQTNAAKAGCSAQWTATITCRDQHPNYCNGAALIPDETCRPQKDALDDCLRGGGDPCTAPQDPCNQCECKACQCVGDCQTGQKAYGDCIAACKGSQTLQACLGACNGSTAPAFQAYVDCYANSCGDVCDPTGT